MRIIMITIALLLSACQTRHVPGSGDGVVDFVVFGDTAYLGRHYADFEALVGLINETAPAFVVHVGDIRGSAETPCTDAHYETVRDTFNRIDAPLIYTPGDNEWTDCWEPGSGAPDGTNFNPQERLTALRRIFFPADMSLGREPQRLERQADVSAAFPEMVENARWRHEGVLFFTVHITGSNNSWLVGSDAPESEYSRRSAANIAWIEESFALAEREGAKAIVMFFHAEIDPDNSGDLGNPKKAEKVRRHQIGIVDGFADIRNVIRERSLAAPMPVLQVYGDFHRFTLIQPYRETVWSDGSGEDLGDHVMRLQVYGSPHTRAVRVRVDPAQPWTFEVTPLFIE